ncbi:MAG: universal stress protein [Thermodesulfobacteriota bacterium]
MSDARNVETILVPTDFSPDAAAALDWARALAAERGARIVLAHAVMVTTPPAPEYLPIEERFWSALGDEARKQLDALAASLRAQGLAVETELTIEPVVAHVLEVAARQRADVIVAGTRGLTRWKRVVLGSVAARLVRTAGCPVVTVRADEQRAPRPVRTILVPTDFSDDAARAAGAAATLLGTSPGRRLVLLHAYRYPAVFGSAPAIVLAHAIERLVADTERAVEEIAARLRGQGTVVESRAVEGPPWQVILEHAQEVDADLIAMGTHGRSGLDRLLLGSTAERVLSAAPCPVLTVHCAEAAAPDARAPAP